MMPRNVFIGRSRQWLEAKLKLLQEDYASTMTTTSYSAGDVTFSKTRSVELEAAIDQVLYALHLIAPDDYPAAQIRRIRVTVGRFRDR